LFVFTQLITIIGRIKIHFVFFGLEADRLKVQAVSTMRLFSLAPAKVVFQGEKNYFLIGSLYLHVLYLSTTLQFITFSSPP
jgi:hypothetical protein